MNKNWAKLVATGAILTVPAIASAQNNITVPSAGFLGKLLQPIIPTSTDNLSLSALVSTVFLYLIIIAGVLAVFYLIWAGIQYITAGGDDDKAKNAKKGIFNAITGIVVIILAYVIVAWVGGLVRSAVQPNGTLNPNTVNNSGTNGTLLPQ